MDLASIRTVERTVVVFRWFVQRPLGFEVSIPGVLIWTVNSSIHNLLQFQADDGITVFTFNGPLNVKSPNRQIQDV